MLIEDLGDNILNIALNDKQISETKVFSILKKYIKVIKKIKINNEFKRILDQNFMIKEMNFFYENFLKNLNIKQYIKGNIDFDKTTFDEIKNKNLITFRLLMVLFKKMNL